MWNTTIPGALHKEQLIDEEIFELFQSQFKRDPVAAQQSVLRMLKRRLPLTGDAGFTRLCVILYKTTDYKKHAIDLCADLESCAPGCPECHKAWVDIQKCDEQQQEQHREACFGVNKIGSVPGASLIQILFYSMFVPLLFCTFDFFQISTSTKL